jgi:hypothetical protein
MFDASTKVSFGQTNHFFGCGNGFDIPLLVDENYLRN